MKDTVKILHDTQRKRRYVYLHVCLYVCVCREIKRMRRWDGWDRAELEGIVRRR
jgi:adenylate cyclase